MCNAAKSNPVDPFKFTEASFPLAGAPQRTVPARFHERMFWGEGFFWSRTQAAECNERFMELRASFSSLEHKIYLRLPDEKVAEISRYYRKWWFDHAPES